MFTPQPNLHVRTVHRGDFAAASRLLGQGMADNPMHLNVYGGDESSSARGHEQVMRTLLRGSAALHIEGVESGSKLVGIAASAPAGHCQPATSTRLRLLGAGLALGPGTLGRLLAWSGAWRAHDPETAHVHLGPVAVARTRRGQGIGTLLMIRHVSRLDSTGAMGYLETDRRGAVDFYRRFGYLVTREAEVLGVPCWFMTRPAR